MTESEKVLRGGSGIGSRDFVRASYRSGSSSGFRGSGVGFRVMKLPSTRVILRVVRGGSWDLGRGDARRVCRSRGRLGSFSNDLGFRVMKTGVRR